jgi:hypothetical protein
MEIYGDAVDNSFYYGYGDPEQYFSSESQSPGSSTVRMLFLRSGLAHDLMTQ